MFFLFQDLKKELNVRIMLGELKCVKTTGLSTATKKLSLELDIAVITLVKNEKSVTLIPVSCFVNANQKININEYDVK